VFQRPASSRFNGAAVRRPRRAAEDDQFAALFGLASTGPRSGDRGELSLALRERLAASGLQRGRGPETAERRDTMREAFAAGAASTGPRSGDRGESPPAPDPRSARRASTGPRSGDRGERRAALMPPRTKRCFNGAAVRRPRRVASWSKSSSPSAKLQRGRGPETAERLFCSKSCAAAGQSFNGAAVRRPRRVPT
jgi:hypothetical protein